VPLLINGESGIIAGHSRVLAARKLGMTEVPCMGACLTGSSSSAAEDPGAKAHFSTF
jgi:hypothetical protein